MNSSPIDSWLTLSSEIHTRTFNCLQDNSVESQHVQSQNHLPVLHVLPDRVLFSPKFRDHQYPRSQAKNHVEAVCSILLSPYLRPLPHWHQAKAAPTPSLYHLPFLPCLACSPPNRRQSTAGCSLPRVQPKFPPHCFLAFSLKDCQIQREPGLRRDAR